MKTPWAWFKSFCARKRWKRDVRKNQARHPALLQMIKNGEEDPVVAAGRMLIQDRKAARAAGMRPEDPRYPILTDYHYMEPLSHSIWPFEGLRRLWRLLFEGSLV